MITGSKELIRDINSHLILKSIITDGPISRADLAKKLGLTKATVSAIVQILLDDRLVLEIGSASTKKGRRPILLDFNHRAGQIICLDLEPDHITAFTSDLKGTHCTLKQLPPLEDPSTALSSLTSILEDIIAGLEKTDYGVVGICLGIHGIVHDNRIIFTPYYDLGDPDLARKLSAHFQIPVLAENEANLSVLGERTFCFPYSNMLNISIHSGIGMGILIDDVLYKGNRGFAGEFGHTIYMPKGRPCPCGNQGCLEQYASEWALLSDLAAKKGKPSISMDDFLKLYQNQDADALCLVSDFIHYMSVGINNALNLFNPSLIIINSAFTIHIPDLTERIEQQLHSRIGPYCSIRPSSLQDTAILLGGACLSIKNFLGIDHFFLTSTD